MSYFAKTTSYASSFYKVLWYTTAVNQCLRCLVLILWYLNDSDWSIAVAFVQSEFTDV